MAKLRRGEEEWEVTTSKGLHFNEENGVSGVYSKTLPQADDILIDDRGNEVRVMSITPTKDEHWHTVQWRTY